MTIAPVNPSIEAIGACIHVIAMKLTLPSKGTLLYCFMAFMASVFLSNITSAVPRDLDDRS